ncbi:LysR family transcriptional regulator [Rhizobium sp. R693]|uniref:LysR family transcriptional regulator n=1 Tax=Rhizobium sp. R693 TaxID=1764276 RepID=UPI000B52D390|nr:LysR family transcriptional regulator [Rhizobium sp. R693]OWV96333.1 transcriptional regulator [Rhizobium sp. R693]
MKDIRTLDLNLLRTLDALLDERSVTKAAQRLGLTQPAVSGMLTRLRKSFEDPLFVRTQRGIVPTLRATQLTGPLKQVLADVERLFQPSVFEPSMADFTVAVAASDYALVAVVAPFLAQLRLRASGIRVAIRSADHARIQAQFESGDIDLALITPEEAPPDLHARGLFDERYVCALRAGHPDGRSTPLTLDRFCELDHALVSYSGQQFWGVTDDALTKVGRERRVVLSVNSFMALTDVLRRTDLIAVVPRRLVSDGDGLVTFEPPVDIPGFTKLAVWHERTHRDPGHRWVRSILFEACGALGSE